MFIGLEIDDLCVYEFLEKIKNYLFFYKSLDKHNYSRNRFYKEEWVNEDNGFFMFLCPRANLKNSTITIQLTGKFFKSKTAIRFVDFVLSDYYSMVNFQRVDVALDCCYDSLDGVEIEENTKLIGFPFPSYSKRWNKKKIGFEVYGRLNHDMSNFFINMVSQGRNDTRLRVYDKSLDLLEKYNDVYSGYYDLKENYKKVYRIEFQARSDKLKSFISMLYASDDENIKPDSYINLCYDFLGYILYKYDFKFVNKEEFGDNLYIGKFNPNKESTLLGQLRYARNMQNSFYKRCLDLYEEIRLRNEQDAQAYKLKMDSFFKNLEKEHKELVNEPFKVMQKSILDYDFQDLSKNMNVPF